MKFVVPLLFSILIIGCKTSPAVYKSSSINTNELGHIKQKANGNLYSGVRAVYTLPDEVEVVSTSFWGITNHLHVKLEPGKYKIVVWCRVGGHPGNDVDVILDVEPSKVYDMVCYPEANSRKHYAVFEERE
ncbi:MULTISPECIES: hypothetical protein [unclassified Pseudoalteromonas]|uniref:hypothetical protein n=1 Tax=unclassified Pseudoalteromonas TaxID=194690 RepID=UPI0020978018|nr:hypothetical protein [Pseudoalteromonas sp. XMcav2-N]MCO7188528.1 hypothetical protein [Pseudoalteromonas sp. XMcav2-N]